MTTALEKDLSTPVPQSDRRGSHAMRWWVLAVLGLAQLMVVLDATVVNIALPHAQADLGFSNGDRQWVITGYALAFGSLLLLGGRLSDLFGRRTTFIVGLIGFAVASAVGGAAGNFEILVGSRVAQGVFAALLAPAALSLLTVTFTEPGERAKAFGIFGAIAGAGGALGLLLGGALTEWVSWRWVMYVNLFFAAIALVGAILLLAKHTATQRPKLDLPGTLTVTAALFGIVYGFSHAESDGWTNSVTLAFLIGGAVLLAAFVYIETRVAHPLLPMRVVLDRTRGASYIVVFTTGIGMFAMFLFLTYYMQQQLAFSPIMTGVAFLPMVAGMVAASTTVPALVVPRVGPKVTAVFGFALAATGMALLTRIGVDTAYASHILPSLILMGLGLGFALSTAFSRRDLGRASHRRRCRFGHGEHQPAGRRLDRHRTAEHLRRHRREQLCGRPCLRWRAVAAGAGRGRGGELHHHLLVGRRDLRGRRGGGRVRDAEQGSGALRGRTRSRALTSPR